MSIDQTAGPATADRWRAAGADPARAPAPRLSRAAARVNDGLGIPMTAVAGIEAQDPARVREHSVALNRLISGAAPGGAGWQALARQLDGDLPGALRDGDGPAFPALWDAAGLEALEEHDLRGLEREWRARTARHPRWARAARAIRPEPDYAAVWRDVLGGDFDLRGRGADYTAGMQAFQASRWLGARTLVRLLGAERGGTFVDVLGGDGYVWRLLEAEKRLSRTRLLLADDPALFFSGAAGGDLPAPVRALMERVRRADPRGAVLVARPGGGAGYEARIVSADGEGWRASRVLSLSAAEMRQLARDPRTVRVVDGGAADARSAPAGREDDGALVITNDISPHMFYRAGLWGMPTRETAERLSRTFREESLDGALLAYGTHHVSDLFAAAAESHAVVRPGGTVVVHDFFDEGPAGQWFHRVVDRYSKTGHDIPHIGPVQMAAVLFASGFRDVALHEIQDPFLFASPEGEAGAPALAVSYLLGMYGMRESFEGKHDLFRGLVEEILTYPEAGEVPFFSDELVYVPRRAVVATARRAVPGEPYSAADLALIRRIGRVLRAPADEVARAAGAPPAVTRYWFTADGSRWGVSPARQRAWSEWERGLSAA